jgi:hypothetical protein
MLDDFLCAHGSMLRQIGWLIRRFGAC